MTRSLTFKSKLAAPKTDLSDLHDLIKYPSNPFSTVSRKYDSLNISKLQGSSHQKIIEIGTEIHKQNQEKYEAELAQAVAKTEAAVWSQAQYREGQILDETRKESLTNQEKVVKKLKRDHLKLMKEEREKIQNQMKAEESIRLRDLNLENTRRLREAVREKEEECERKLVLMIAETRKQEQQLAKVELARVEREHKEHIEQLIKEKEEERANAVLNMVTKMMGEKEKAIERVKADEAKKYKAMFDDLKKRHYQEKKKIEAKVTENKAKIEALREDLHLNKMHQTNVQNKLLSLHHSFHDYVNATSKNAHNQTAFIVPPLHDI